MEDYQSKSLIVGYLKIYALKPQGFRAFFVALSDADGVKCKKKFADLFFRRIFAVPKDNRGVAQLVSASGLGPEGPVFESQYPDLGEQSNSAALFFCFYVPHPVRNDH